MTSTMEDSAATLADITNSSNDDNSAIDDASAKEKKDINLAVDDAESLPKVKEDPILDYAIHYAINNANASDELTKEKQRYVKGLATLIFENGEVYLRRKNNKS